LFAQQHGGNDTFIVEDSCHIRLDEATKETLRADIAVVEFEATANTKYALDQYRDVYAKVTEFLQKYKASNKDMAASAKFMLPGVSDEIFVRVIESKEGFDPAKGLVLWCAALCVCCIIGGDSEKNFVLVFEWKKCINFNPHFVYILMYEQSNNLLTLI
jgi:hypothetical protein